MYICMYVCMFLYTNVWFYCVVLYVYVCVKIMSAYMPIEHSLVYIHTYICKTYWFTLLQYDIVLHEHRKSLCDLCAGEYMNIYVCMSCL